GADARPAEFRFFCTSNDGPNVTGALAVELHIPRYEQLRPMFDFDPFEGPSAHAGPLTQLQAVGVRARAHDRFTAAGSAESGAAFMLEVAASRREAAPLQRLAAVLRPLLDGPGQLVWRQSNARPGGTSLVASLDLAQAKADQLRAALAPCLARR